MKNTILILDQKSYNDLLDKLLKIMELIEKSKRKPSEIVYTEDEVCEQLKVNSKTIRAWRKDGSIKFAHKGNKFFYTFQDVLDFINKQRV